jgi:hypothetical protein
MRSVLLALSLAIFAMPAIVLAHGSNVLDPAHSSDHDASHHSAASSHDDHPHGTLAEEVEELHDDIDNLQDQLRAHDERIRLTDIVGGIGYIVGITGVAYYYLGSRRQRNRDGAQPTSP